MTIAERLRQEGIALGQLQGERRLLELQLERRFGPLPAEARERVRAASGKQLEDWANRIFDADSLEELLAE